MTTISTSTATSTAAASSTTSTSSTSSSSDLDTSDFLQLLVEEIQNQNPLDPTDTSEFMGQMMSYASYSQQTEMNSTLLSIQESLTSLTDSLSAAA